MVFTVGKGGSVVGHAIVHSTLYFYTHKICVTIQIHKFDSCGH